MFSIPASKGFEIGSGFRGMEMRGLARNDPFVLNSRGGLLTKTNIYVYVWKDSGNRIFQSNSFQHIQNF